MLLPRISNRSAIKTSHLPVMHPKQRIKCCNGNIGHLPDAERWFCLIVIVPSTKDLRTNVCQHDTWGIKDGPICQLSQ